MASPRQLATPKVPDTSGLSADANMDIDEDEELSNRPGLRELDTATPVPSAERVASTVDFTPPVLALAREVLRRADYQRKPPSDTRVNKPLRFEGMTEEQAKLCSPEEMVDRFVDLLGKRQGREAADRLRGALEYVQRQPAIDKPKSVMTQQAANKAPSQQNAPQIAPETPLPAASPLPMPGPAANGVVPTAASRLRSASLNAAQRESKVVRDSTVQIDRLGPKPQALLGKPIPVGGRAATSSSPAPRAPRPQEHSATSAPSRVASAGPGAKPAPSQPTPTRSAQVQQSDDRAGNFETVVGASGSRIVRVTSRP